MTSNKPSLNCSKIGKNENWWNLGVFFVTMKHYVLDLLNILWRTHVFWYLCFWIPVGLTWVSRPGSGWIPYLRALLLAL